MRADLGPVLPPQNTALVSRAATCIPIGKIVRLAPRCLRGNKAPRGRPPSPTRRQAQSPSQNPAGLGFSPAQLLQCAEFQCGSFPLLAAGLDRQTDGQADGRAVGREVCCASAQPPRDWGLQGERAGQPQAWCPHKVPPAAREAVQELKVYSGTGTVPPCSSHKDVPYPNYKVPRFCSWAPHAL